MRIRRKTHSLIRIVEVLVHARIHSILLLIIVSSLNMAYPVSVLEDSHFMETHKKGEQYRSPSALRIQENSKEEQEN